VPLDGAFDGLRHFRLREPDGIAIDLPNARGAASRQRYPVRHPGVSRIDVSPWGAGTRLRIWVQQPFHAYDLDVEPGGLRIVLPVTPIEPVTPIPPVAPVAPVEPVAP
jgi:AMIN domain